MPKFGGGAAKPAAAPAPPPPPRAPWHGVGSATVAGAGGGKLDAEEEARRAQRASRFDAPAGAVPPAAAGRQAVLPRPALAVGSAFSAGGDEDAGENDGEDL